MADIKLAHEIRCDADTFWKLFFDREFNERLYKDALGFPEFTILELKETEREIFRKAAGQPKMNVPAPVAKLLGSGFRYTEEGTFDRATKVFRWKMFPSTLADKLTQNGSVRVEPAGDGRVKRITELLVEARVFGVGKLIESSAEKQLRDGWDKSAVFMNDWIAKHGGTKS